MKTYLLAIFLFIVTFCYGKERNNLYKSVNWTSLNNSDSLPVKLLNQKAFNFKLPNADGVFKSLYEFKGKIIVIDFWFTGCPGCLGLAPKLKEVESYYQGKPVVFITISVDKDKEKWISSLKSNKYTSPNAINLFTEGKGEGHKVVNKYLVTGYPSLFIIDKYGYFVKLPKDPRLDNGVAMINVLNHELEKSKY